MYKIAVMGDKDSIYGFSTLGMDIYAEEGNGAKETLDRLVTQNYAIIFVTEAVAAFIPEEIEKYRDHITPAIILIPGITGNTGEGLKNISEIVRKAVGADLIK